jgi:hypothetical protein
MDAPFGCGTIFTVTLIIIAIGITIGYVLGHYVL